MNFNEVVYKIENTMKFGCRPGLERTAALLELLDNPHKKLRFVHVAGTNGKGSTTAMIANILKCAGYKAGMYISPHLYSIQERMTINNEKISEQDFTKYAVRVIDTIEYMKKNNMEEPTQFEMLTAMAFLYFAEEKVDIAVIEVGLGGAYDATNVIGADEVLSAVITSISYDHMDILGNSIEEIAAEKAGIIKRNSYAVVYPQLYKEALAVIEKKSKQMDGILVKVDDKSICNAVSNANGHTFDFNSNNVEYQNLSLPLIGDHQLKNAATVLEVINVIRELHYNIREEHIRTGLGTVEWPCRLSIVSKKPLILIDGAHNEDGVNSLKSALQKYFDDKKIIFVFGMLKDKSYKYAIEQLMPLAESVVATQPISPRALTAAEMAEEIRPLCSEVEAEEDIIKAIEKAKAMCGEQNMICICGSLYLAGSAYEYLQES